MKSRRFIQCGGFTLLEVIITMTVAAILAAILFSFMSTNITGSVTPLVRVQNANTLTRVFENITADYNKLNSDDVDNNTAAALSTLNSHINSGNVTTNNPYYGSYNIVYKAYIAFDGSGNQIADTSGNNRILKVKLQQGDQTITTLFAK